MMDGSAAAARAAASNDLGGSRRIMPSGARLERSYEQAAAAGPASHQGPWALNGRRRAGHRAESAARSRGAAASSETSRPSFRATEMPRERPRRFRGELGVAKPGFASVRRLQISFGLY